MKVKLALAAWALFISAGLRAGTDDEKDSLGLPGDNLDLYGVMDLFKKATSLEEFEKALNTESNHINNLDLNGDDEIDYIRVSDFTDSNAHAIILQVPVSAEESQDVAVIELESPEQEKAYVQIVGDEELYGENYIVEPFEESDDKSPLEKQIRVVVNVWAWPCVRFVYAPVYRPWVSPWKWRAYPNWWKPWRPVAWHIHWGHVRPYHAHFHRTYVYRGARAHRYYHNHRVASATVHARYAPAHQHHKAHHKAHHDKHKTNHKVKNQPKNEPARKADNRQKGGGGKSPGGKGKRK
ncbi:MAG: hypothetical protein ACOZCO_01685 [Bacteroidota bacterium]